MLDATKPEDRFWNPESHWDEHPEHHIEDWKYEIANDDTRQSYIEWVNSRLAQELEEQLPAYRKAASEIYGSEGSIEFDDEPAVSLGEDRNGAYVQAWVWVAMDEAGICRICKATNADNGEGYQGVCGDCCDKEDAA